MFLKYHFVLLDLHTSGHIQSNNDIKYVKQIQFL